MHCHSYSYSIAVDAFVSVESFVSAVDVRFVRVVVFFEMVAPLILADLFVLSVYDVAY